MTDLSEEWKIIDSRLEKIFRFDDFEAALSFVNRVAEVAETLNHHPDISLYSYNQVRISTSTHKQNKVTEKDYFLAREIDKIV